MSADQQHDPGLPLLRIVPPWLIMLLTIVTFLLATGGLLLGMFAPELFEHPIARFSLCAAIAAYFGVFFFVLYPQVVEVSQLPGIALPRGVKLVGPVALFLILLLILLNWMPVAAPGRFFYADYDGAARVHVDNFHVEATDETFEHFIAVDKNRNVTGLYIRFASGRDEYQARIAVDYRSTVKTTFERGVDEGSFLVPRGRNERTE